MMCYLRGTCKWAKLYKPDEKYGNYGVNLYPNKDSIAMIHKMGLSGKMKKDDDGEFIKLSRKKANLVKGVLKEYGPPEVLDKDNKPMQDLVGNGSEITVKIDVFETQAGISSRLESVRVENLVRYEGGPRVDQDSLLIAGKPF